MNLVPAHHGEMFQVPSLRRRMASLLYEILILFGVTLIPSAVSVLLFAFTGQPQDVAGRWVAFAVYGIYFVWFWSQRGQTLPMQTWNIRVVRSDGTRLGVARCAARYFAACAWVAPAVLLAWRNGWTKWELLTAVGVGVGVYAAMALLHPQRQFWHDALCGTRLIDHSLPKSQTSA